MRAILNRIREVTRFEIKPEVRGDSLYVSLQSLRESKVVRRVCREIRRQHPEGGK